MDDGKIDGLYRVQTRYSRPCSATAVKDAVNLELVKAMVEIAHTMGKLVIAEWVETEEVMHLLERTGVDYIQGHIISEAIPLHQLLTLD